MNKMTETKHKLTSNQKAFNLIKAKTNYKHLNKITLRELQRFKKE